MHLPFPILPVDSLGQPFHLSSVQAVLICNLTSSSFGQEIGNFRAESTKHVQNIITIIIAIIIIIITTREKKDQTKQTKNPTQTVPRAMTINDTGEKWVLQMPCCPSFWVGGQRKNKAF